MELTVEKISDEKYRVTLTKDSETIHQDERYHTYMGQIMFRRRDVTNLVLHLEDLYGEKITKVINLMYNG